MTYNTTKDDEQNILQPQSLNLDLIKVIIMLDSYKIFGLQITKIYLQFKFLNPKNPQYYLVKSSHEQRVKTKNLLSISRVATYLSTLSVQTKTDSYSFNKKKSKNLPKTIPIKTCSLSKSPSGKNKNVPHNLNSELEELFNKYKAKQTAFQELQNSFNKLKQYYLEINYVLMTYDRQFYKQVLERLYNNMIQLKNKFEPRKRFQFSRRAQDFGVKQDQSKTQKNQKKQQSNQSLAIPGLSGLKNQSITVSNSNDPIGPYKIIQCENATIQLQQKTEILFLKELKNCKISCALSKSTVFVDNCKDCIFELNCHQLRIHNTYDTTFKIFVTSKAIIEDCNRVIFTPYTYDYPNKIDDLRIFERENEHNFWREIQDFNWLKENQKSPHYELKETI